MSTDSPLRIVFMGTPTFAVPALEALMGAGHHVVAVYSQPPKPCGRGHKVTPSPVQEAAEAQGIPVLTPKSLRQSEAQKVFQGHQADVAVVVAYGLILPSEILGAPRFGCLNIHGSLLPRWRGAAPIQRAIQAGDSQSGITIMQMDEGLDTGAMLAKEAVALTSATTGQSLHDALSKLGARMIVQTLDRLQALNPMPQPEEGVVYATKLSKEESWLDFQKSAQELDRDIRAYTPWPGSCFQWQERLVKVLKAQGKFDGEGSGGDVPGTLRVTRDAVTIACGHGVLVLQEIQIQGKKPMDIKAFINGYRPQDGEVITPHVPL